MMPSSIEPQPMTLHDLNGQDQGTFVESVGWVFEHSPWVAERAWIQGPFGTVTDLHAAMVAVVGAAPREEQLALLRAHPDLGSRLHMSEVSTSEQAGAGLEELSREAFDRLTQLNAAYRERFGFPFLLAVKGATPQAVLDALTRRVDRSLEQEWAEALAQVARIARFRLDGLFREV
jgi:OHCU decarboxylase